jgi:hypothetical protein
MGLSDFRRDGDPPNALTHAMHVNPIQMSPLLPFANVTPRRLRSGGEGSAEPIYDSRNLELIERL